MIALSAFNTAASRPSFSAPRRVSGLTRKNRNGRLCYRCYAGVRSFFADESTWPADRRWLPEGKAVLCLWMLLEGKSIRSVERLTCCPRCC